MTWNHDLHQICI